jgi:outer membrane protein assembly factor BamD
MNFGYRFLAILLIMFLTSCTKEVEKISVITENDIETQMIEFYKEGLEALEDGDGFYAAKKFNEAAVIFPQSEWAPKSLLMAAYSHYSQSYYIEAIMELEQFLNTYPNHERVSYAHFLLAMCYYESIVDEKKDLEPLLKAEERFKFIIKEYPNTDFALDSKYKINLINDILASKEIYIGKHYMKKEKWIAAINRFKTVVDEYNTTIYVEEALHRLVEIYYKIGLEEESKKYASALGYNYLSGDWYKKSYKIFDKNYKDPKKVIKKKGNFITRKFKSLFD